MKSQEGGLLLIACLQAFVTLIAAQVSIEQQRRKKVQHFVHTAVWYCSKTRLSTVESYDHRCSSTHSS